MLQRASLDLEGTQTDFQLELSNGYQRLHQGEGDVPLLPQG
jgi:hypothetical protein